MNKLLKFILCLFLIGPNKLYAQGIKQGPLFYCDLVNSASSYLVKSRLDLYLKVPNDQLQFVKNRSGFEANYEVSISVVNEKGEAIETGEWQRKVVVDSYWMTNSREYGDLTHTFFLLKPGRYKIFVQLTDLDTGQKSWLRSTVKLRDFGFNRFSLSDITYADYLEADSSGVKLICPNVSGRLDSGADVYAYFEIYSHLPGDSIKVSYKIKDHRKKTMMADSYFIKKRGYSTPTYIKIARGELRSGRYLMDLKVQQGKCRASTKKPFTMHWVGVPLTPLDLELAIEQLEYIAEGEELKKLKRASGEERLKLFIQFWQRRDPTPGTPVNELMEEYYRRVEYANQNFSTFRDGWKTDRGMVYIIYGPPEEIERHPFEPECKPHEIWHYHDRTFIFIDDAGCGLYRLTFSPRSLWYWRK